MDRRGFFKTLAGTVAAIPGLSFLFRERKEAPPQGLVDLINDSGDGWDSDWPPDYLEGLDWELDDAQRTYTDVLGAESVVSVKPPIVRWPKA